LSTKQTIQIRNHTLIASYLLCVIFNYVEECINRMLSVVVLLLAGIH